MSKKPPRIVTVCVEGYTASGAKAHLSDRLNWLKELVHHANCRWAKIDAVLFPGGYFYLKNCHFGNLSHKSRVEYLGLLRGVSGACKSMNGSPSALIVAGVDANLESGLPLDQLCVAWNGTEIAGIGRKIFPVGGHEGEADELICYEQDFSASSRNVSLAGGGKGTLCACYDGYAVGRRTDGKAWEKSVKWVSKAGHRIAECWNPTKVEVANLSSRFNKLLDPVTLALVSIHTFERNSTAYWQRHGINEASLALTVKGQEGGYSYGAAHFNNQLPSRAEVSVLAAARGHELHPSDWFYLWSKSGAALVRLFG